MSARRRGRECEKDQAQSDGGRTGANPEADQPSLPGGSLYTFNHSTSITLDLQICITMQYYVCAITDGKLGCSSGGKIHQMLKTKKIPITSVSHQQHVCYCIRTCNVICTR
ncbi:hypothetical protein T08_4199 [Trichinella sp. T8]|nr:hypothetical protein T08_4199 [Trichinella sp. T8]